MTRRAAIRILRRAFAALTARQRANLRWHAEKGTPVLCGKNAYLYYSAEWADLDDGPMPPPGGG